MSHHNDRFFSKWMDNEEEEDTNAHTVLMSGSSAQAMGFLDDDDDDDVSPTVVMSRSALDDDDEGLFVELDAENYFNDPDADETWIRPKTEERFEPMPFSHAETPPSAPHRAMMAPIEPVAATDAAPSTLSIALPLLVAGAMVLLAMGASLGAGIALMLL